MDEKKIKRVPGIRFPGFTDAWEQRKFGELLNETREKTTVEDEDTLLSCAIDGMFLNSELFSHFRGSSNIGYLKVKKNDLILSAQNLHLGNCNVNLRFEHGIISPAYKVYELINCNPLFMQAWVKQDKTKDFFLKASTEGASVCRKNIVWEELYKQELPVPEIDEQEKIGKFFQNLDNLITLHQRKLDAMKEYKKGMLQKMFPREGNDVPEIRFPGFTAPWEQRKYSEIINLLSGQDFEPSDYNDKGNGTPYMTGASCIDNGKTMVSRWTSRPKCIAEKGDVLLVCKGSGCGTIAVLVQDKAHIARQFMALKCTDILDNQFNLFLASSVVDEIKKDTRGLIAGIARDAVLNQNVYIPNIDEQKIIGVCLSNIDDLITLHQRKLDAMKEYKKGLLQQMFV